MEEVKENLKKVANKEIKIEITNMNEFKEKLDRVKSLVDDLQQAIESVNNFEFIYQTSSLQ